MDCNKDDLVFLVTGGSSGIGEDMVNFLSKNNRGFVYLIDLNEERGKIIESKNTKTKFIRCDVTNDLNVEYVLKIIKEESKRLDVLINCAGIAHIQNFISKTRMHSSKKFEEIFKINAYGTFNLIKHVSKFMIQNYNNSNDLKFNIINIASILGLVGSMGSVAYSASKGAIIGMTIPLARELGKYNIRVNCICPGLIDTPMSTLQEKGGMLNSSPIKKIGISKDIVEAVNSILENDFINGSNISVDGGALTPHF